MNIFYLSENPKRAARYHCDKHIVKMTTESAQMLCTNLIIAGVRDVPFKLTHHNHPCTIWARENRENFEFLCEFLFCQATEYTARYGRTHKSFALTEPFLKSRYARKFPVGSFTHPPQCMPEFLQRETTVLGYREFYNRDKYRFARWQYSEVPYWFKPGA